MNILEIKQLTKHFGDQAVLKNLDMKVPEHAIFGFVGQNGAGKTTTMKLILGLLKADSGRISICGEEVTYGETKTNRSIGYLPDVPEFYDYMTPKEYLLLCGEITGLSRTETLSKSEDLLNLVGLKNEERKIKSFSRGMKQRLGIAQALLNEPKLLICDEPTSALDPIGRKEILDILLAIKGKTTVIFSTHILSDVERVCDYVAFLHKGKLVLQGPLSEIKARNNSNSFSIEFANESQLSRFVQSKKLAAFPSEIVRNKNTLTIRFENTQQDGLFLVKLLSEQQIVPLKFEKIETSLEHLFTEVVQ